MKIISNYLSEKRHLKIELTRSKPNFNLAGLYFYIRLYSRNIFTKTLNKLIEYNQSFIYRFMRR